MPELHPDYVKSHRARLVKLSRELQESLRVVAPEESAQTFPIEDRIARIMNAFHKVINEHVTMGSAFDIEKMSDDRKNDLLWQVWRIASGQE